MRSTRAARSSTTRTRSSPGRRSRVFVLRSTEHLDASLKYRFFNADNVKLVDVIGRNVRRSFPFAQHPGRPDLQLRRAGSAAAAAAAPAAASPAAAAASAAASGRVCTPGRTSCSSSGISSDITPEASGILDNAVSALPELRQRAGHAGRSRRRSGSASYNVGLSQRRADSVRSYLTVARHRRWRDLYAKRSAKAVRASRPPMASANCRTAAWKSCTGLARACKPLRVRLRVKNWGGRSDPASLFLCRTVNAKWRKRAMPLWAASV